MTQLVFKVRVTKTEIYEMEVASPDKSLFVVEGYAQLEFDRKQPEALLTGLSFDVIEQLAGPWVYGGGIEASNKPDGYLNTRNLLVFKTPRGHRFSVEDVTRLKQRVTNVVGPVLTHWNGEGCSSLSITTVEDFGELTEEQRAALLAPQ